MGMRTYMVGLGVGTGTGIAGMGLGREQILLERLGMGTNYCPMQLSSLYTCLYGFHSAVTVLIW